MTFPLFRETKRFVRVFNAKFSNFIIIRFHLTTMAEILKNLIFCIILKGLLSHYAYVCVRVYKINSFYYRIKFLPGNVTLFLLFSVTYSIMHGENIVIYVTI